MRTITCADCSRERETRYANTKYCLVCRLARNLQFLGERTSQCIVCENRFAPLSRNDDLCGVCDNFPASGEPTGTCALCETIDIAILNEDVSVCKRCAKDPEKRVLFRKAVILKRQRAMESK